MPANAFDLAIALVQAAPEVVPQLIEKLGNHVTPEQKQSLLSIQKPAKPSPLMQTISGAQWRVPPSEQFEQNFMDTIRYVPRKELNDIVYSVARERHRQVKEHFLFLRLFLIICLLAFVTGVILFFYFPSVGGTFTAIGSFAGVIGSIIFKSYSESHKRLDTFLKDFPQFRGQ